MQQKYYITNDGISHNEMLGSQTFNYFALYAISKKTGHEVAISTAPHLHQGLLPQCFDLPFSLFPQDAPYEIYNSSLCHVPVIEKELFNLNPNKNYIINARMDFSYVYWGKLLEELKSIFKIKQIFLEEAKNIIQNINKPLACFNFRRGVYSFYMDNYMGYYKKALELIPSDAVILVMSDDFEWVNNSPDLLNLLEGREIIKANYKDYVQLSLITMSDYNVICPSSFPLLGHVLSKPSQTAIFPNFYNTSLYHLTSGFQKVVDEVFPNFVQIKNWENYI